MTTIQNQKFRRCFRCLGLGIIIDVNNPEASDECDICFGEGKIIQCTNCGKCYEETTINIIECSECKTDAYLMEKEGAYYNEY